MLPLLELSQFLICICKIIFTITISSLKILKLLLDVFILAVVLIEFSFGLLQLFILKLKSFFILTNLCLDTARFALNGFDFKLQIINLCFQLGLQIRQRILFLIDLVSFFSQLFSFLPYLAFKLLKIQFFDLVALTHLLEVSCDSW